MNLLSIQGVSRTFTSHKGTQTQALLPVDFEVRENDFVTILGPSGCGKSTMLRIVAGLDFPTTGQVLLDGGSIKAKLDENKFFAKPRLALDAIGGASAVALADSGCARSEASAWALRRRSWRNLLCLRRARAPPPDIPLRSPFADSGSISDDRADDRC